MLVTQGGKGGAISLVQKSDNDITKMNASVNLTNGHNGVRISNCVYQENIAHQNGGSIYSDSSSIVVNNTTFKNNIAHMQGGA